jgi:hypothetical protein
VKRGQSSFEFFMSYGWAVAAALVALGGLAYFSLYDPHNFLPDTCLLGPGLTCVQPIYQHGPITPSFSVGVIGFNVINNLGKDLVDFFVTVDPDHSQCGGWTAMITSSNLAATIPVGSGVDPNSFNGTKVFKNGERRPIVILRNDTSLYLPVGFLPCRQVFDSAQGGNPSVIFAHCCDANLSKTFYNPPNGLCPNHAFNQTVCLANVDMSKVKRFQSKLWIFYREQGSSILHKRVGEFNVGESGCVFLNCPGCVGTC